MLTRATVPLGLPHAPLIPVCSLSAPAQDNILLIRTTWYGWALTRRWKPSLPAILTRYLVDCQHHVVISCFSRLTCWRKYGQLQEPQSSAARTRWKPCARIVGTRRHLLAFGQGRRFESLGQVHLG